MPCCRAATITLLALAAAIGAANLASAAQLALIGNIPVAQ